MLESLLGSLVREQVLLFITIRGRGYAREISRFFGAPLDSVQKQLKRLEHASILISEINGRTRTYSMNHAHELHREIMVLMEGIAREGPEYGIPGRKREKVSGNSVIVRKIQ